MAVRLKQFIKEESDIFLVSDEYETHYATAYVCDDFMIIIDTDDYWKGADLNRVKLGIEIKGITIVSDEKNIVKEKLDEINKTRKSKKEFQQEIENVVIFDKDDTGNTTVSQTKFNDQGQLEKWPIGFFDPDGV